MIIIELADPKFKLYPKHKWKKCPHCNDEGFWIDANSMTGDPEQVQCQFCYTEHNSIFNQRQLLKETKMKDSRKFAENCNFLRDLGSSSVQRESINKAIDQIIKYCKRSGAEEFSTLIEEEIDDMDEQGVVLDSFSGEVPHVDKYLLLELIEKRLSKYYV